MKYLKPLCVALSLSGALLVGCKKDSPSAAVATYTQSDAVAIEKVTLHADGSYDQSETKKDGSQVDFPSRPQSQGIKGKWLLLDMPRGAKIQITGSIQDLPKEAVVILQNALPFGETSDIEHPYSTAHDRTISAHDFHAK